MRSWTGTGKRTHSWAKLIKVTPSSKAVGDLALFMVQNDLDGAELLRRAAHLSFPKSVVGLLKGRLGRPPYGFPRELQAAVLRGEEPLEDRPGAYLDPVDFEAVRTEVRDLTKDEPVTREASDRDVLSRVLFPQVYADFAAHRAAYGDTSVLDTPTFFYGPKPGERVAADIERGKTLIIRLVSVGEVHADGTRPVLFELNGHAREVRVQDQDVAAPDRRAKAESGNWREVGASMPGKVIKVLVQPGDTVSKGADLLVTEAMKMETALAGPPARGGRGAPGASGRHGGKRRPPPTSGRCAGFRRGLRQGSIVSLRLAHVPRGCTLDPRPQSSISGGCHVIVNSLLGRDSGRTLSCIVEGHPTCLSFTGPWRALPTTGSRALHR